MITDTDIMPFGKYKGEMMQDVPAKYLLRLYNSHTILIEHNYLIDYIELAMDALKQQSKSETVDYGE